MHCIVSGFDAFANFSYNPTQAVVEGLPQSIPVPGTGQQAIVHRLVLQTCCEQAWPAVAALAASLDDQPVLLIHTGLADLRTRINLERFALNLRDYRIPDNHQHQPVDEHIDDHGPEALRTSIPLPDLAATLTSRGILCEVSNHAGSFLCNEVYYRSLRWLQTSGRPGAALFMHFPLPETYADYLLKDGVRIDRTSLMLDPREAILGIFREAVIQTVQFCCTWWMNSELPQVAAAEPPVAEPRPEDRSTRAV